MNANPAIEHLDFARALKPGVPDDELLLPTDEQRAIIEAGNTPALVVAGAGSGKTQTMMLRILWLIAREGIPADHILGLTFTNKAAGELRERVERGLRGLRAAGLIGGSDFDVPQIATYNAYADSIYRQYALLIGGEPDALLLDEASAFSLMREVVVASDDPDLIELGLTVPKLAARALSLARMMRDHGASLAEVEKLALEVETFTQTIPGTLTQGVAKEFQRVHSLVPLARLATAYEARKRALGRIEFSDQVAGAAEILHRDPAIAAELRERAQVVILDEYQDTSSGQIELFSSLFRGHSVMAVGDPKQSIYGWRGASAANMSRFHRDFDGERGGVDFTLSISWRNDRAILSAANTVAAGLDLPNLATVELAPRPGAGEGTVNASWTIGSKEEAERIARWFERQFASRADTQEQPSGAVLVRARSQMAAIAEALNDRGIPHRIVGGGGLLDTPEIADLTSLLKVAADEYAGPELIRLLVGAHAQLGLADVEALWQIARLQQQQTVRGERLTEAERDRQRRDLQDLDGQASIVVALDEVAQLKEGHPLLERFSDTGKTRLRALARTINGIRERLTLPLVELIEYAISASSLDSEVESNPRNATGRANLDAFLTEVANFAAGTPQARLTEFLDWLSIAQEQDLLASVEAPAPQKGVIQLTTMHSAKGLEWDFVAVPQLMVGSMPKTTGSSSWFGAAELPPQLRQDAADLPDWQWRGSEDAKEVATRLKHFQQANEQFLLRENQQLMYVAVTRARAALLLSASLWKAQNVAPVEPSPFLLELVPELTLEHPDGSADTSLTGDRFIYPPQEGTLKDQVKALELTNPASAGGAVPWPKAPMAPQHLERIVDEAERIQRLRALDASDPQRASRYDGVLGLLFEEREQRRACATLTLPDRFGASRFHDLLDDPATIARNQARPMPQEPFTATLVGNLFHAWVESLYAAVAGGAAVLDGTDDDLVDAGLTRVSERDRVRLESLKATFLASRFAANGRTPAAIEMPIETPLGDHTVVGKLDAVYQNDDGSIEIVDWKTGRAPTTPDEIQGRQWQLMLYAHAYARSTQTPLERIRATLYYVADDREITLDQILHEEDLLARLAEASRIAQRSS